MGAGVPGARRPLIVQWRSPNHGRGAARRPSLRSASPVRRRYGRALVALVVVLATLAAALERWWFSGAWGESGSLTSAFYFGDATRFLNYALAIVQGRSFDNGIPFHPPGWPLAIAAVMKIAGAAAVPVGAVKLLLACLSGLTVGMAVLLAYEMAGGGAMLAAALLGTFNFGHIVEGAVANSEALYGLLTAISMWAVWRWLRGGSGRPAAWAALAGAAGGCAMLVRAEFLACAAFFVALAWWVHWTRKAPRAGKAGSTGPGLRTGKGGSTGPGLRMKKAGPRDPAYAPWTRRSLSSSSRSAWSWCRRRCGIGGR